MKVWRLTPGGGIDGLTQSDEPDPTPGPGEVVVRVRATSLNYRDLGIMRRNEQPIVPRTIITSSSDAKLERARALGAHETINYRERPDWERAVLDLTGGRGVDLVVEVGGAGTYAQSLAATRQNGHVVLIGGLAPAEGASVPMVGRQHVTRIGVGSRRMFEDLNRAVEVNAIQPVIDRVFEFGEAREAFAYFESQAHVGKVVIRV
ncbi:MAG: NAD(P)-dependent alcohol dehydrogenase [Dehalococcoidia bacterium]